jgi:hypothetical protein
MHACGPTLASRVTVARVALPDEIRYRRQGYNLIAEDERIAFGIDEGGAPSVGWLDAAGERVHVTSLDATLARRGADTVVKGIDVGGLAARPDDVAVLVRRDDPGEPLADPAANFQIAKAAVLVRIRQGVEQAALPLTGTASAVASTVGPARDCAGSALNGRVEWNGSKYGVYFAVHGCQGDTHASFYGDKLVYLDDGGRALPGGWSWGCSINEGLRLLAGATNFTPICLSDGTPFQGLSLVIEGQPPVLLGPELSAPGYSAGRLGSIVRISETTAIVGWLSRGIKSGGRSGSDAAKPAPDIATVKLGNPMDTVGPLVWASETPNVAEWGLHLAPYGQARLLAVWQSFENLDCNGQTCFGIYTGTHARLMDLDGHFLTPDELITATPNDDEDMRVFPNGDVGFAYVDFADRNRIGTLPLGDGGVPAVPPMRTLSVARIAYCN